MSRTEKLLNALIDGQNIEDYEPQSRIEILLKRICLSENCDDLEPKSRIEYLLKELSSCVGGSGSGEDMLQARVNSDNTCNHLMYRFSGENVDFLKNLDTSKVTSTTSMFYYCQNLTSVPHFNTSKVTNMNSMFGNCSNLITVPQFDTSEVITMESMFAYCDLLGAVPQFDTSKVTNMREFCTNCSNLISVPYLNTDNVTSMNKMFYACYNLETIPQLNAHKVANFTNAFGYCRKLKSLLMYGMKVKFDISTSTQFEASDLVTILSNCQVVNSSQTLTMGSTNLAKLEGVYVKPTGVELYEGITCNPCVICESTDEGAMLATDYFATKGWSLA